ncbi:MAG: ABC transporter ATP-binding protein [Trueperaceae bacterium]|nr:ABC transporter ATP-binding protein [Trueperaceae bacterium]
MSTVLRATGLSKSFGGLVAVKDVSFEAAPGEIFAIIGPNGAGKTTLLNLVSGLLTPTSGRLELLGTDITAMPTYRRCRLGLGRAFQVVQPFPEMTVAENVLVGAQFGSEGVSSVEARRRADRALERTGLDRLRDQPVEDLNLLQEKRLEIARALATQPKVLLLDEVMAGLRPGEARQAVELVRGVRDEGITVVFIEHVMPVVRDLADRVLVMDHGSELARGTYAEVTSDPRVVEAYLGVEDDGSRDGAERAGVTSADVSSTEVPSAEVPSAEVPSVHDAPGGDTGDTPGKDA